MTVSITDRVVTHPGNGATTEFPYDFKIPDEGSVQVSVYDSTTGIETDMELDVDFEITGIGGNDGGTVTYPLSGDPLGEDELLIIQRGIPRTQTTDITNQSTFYRGVIEGVFDRLVMIDQEQDEELGRTLKSPAGEAAIAALPRAETRAGKVLAFDSQGAPIVITPSSGGGLSVSDYMEGVLLADDEEEFLDLAGFDLFSTAAEFLTHIGVPAFMQTFLVQSSKSAARTQLGVIIGTDVQAYNEDLAAIAALTPNDGDVLLYDTDQWTSGSVAGVPAGAVSAFAGSSAPSGYLECNGATVSRTTYSALFAAIGEIYGAGDGSTTFALPDLRAEFIRGWDHGRDEDFGRVIGTWQDASIEPHVHNMNYSNRNDVTATGGQTVVSGLATGGQDANTEDGSADDAVNGETRPRNVAMMYIIKT